MTPVESIDHLVADGIVDALIQRVKTGKEAEVFIVRKGEDYFAAKVYKERTARNFHNNVDYREGRQVRNTRDQRAMTKGTKYGLAMSESDWMHTEHDALVTLLHAGVRVPKPELFYEGVLLMELVLGANGQPAERLIDIPLTPEEAVTQHRDIVGQIVRMLLCDLIHGDLSPYNILLGWNGPTIIDLPQVVKAAHNSQSEKFLSRDVRNVTEHFAKYAPQLKARANDGIPIWRRYMRRDLTPDYFPDEAESAAASRPPNEQGRRRHNSAHRHAGGKPTQAGQPSKPHQQQPQRSGPPGQRPPAPPAAAAPAKPQQGARQHHPRPPKPNNGQPQRNGAPPTKRPAPPGPVIQRVTRLAPPAHASSRPPGHAAPAQPGSSAPAANQGSRFSMRHRRR